MTWPHRPPLVDNPFHVGPCFSGPRDHRFCAEFIVIDRLALGPVGHVFRCPCKCGHPKPPASAWPGKAMDVVVNNGAAEKWAPPA